MNTKYKKNDTHSLSPNNKSSGQQTKMESVKQSPPVNQKSYRPPRINTNIHIHIYLHVNIIIEHLLKEGDKKRF